MTEGWVVHWKITTDVGTAATRYFLAAITDPEAAVEAVRSAIGGEPELILGSQVNERLLIHHKIPAGGVRLVKKNSRHSDRERARIARALQARVT